MMQGGKQPADSGRCMTNICFVYTHVSSRPHAPEAFRNASEVKYGQR